MRRFSAIIFLLCTFALAMSAQHIQRNYHDRSMSDRKCEDAGEFIPVERCDR